MIPLWREQRRIAHLWRSMAGAALTNAEAHRLVYLSELDQAGVLAGQCALLSEALALSVKTPEAVALLRREAN